MEEISTQPIRHKYPVKNARFCPECKQERPLAEFVRKQRRCGPCRTASSVAAAQRRKQRRIEDSFRTCAECGEQKHTSEFRETVRKDRTQTTRLTKYCALCLPIVMRRQKTESAARGRRANPDRQRDTRWRYYQRHRQKLLEDNRQKKQVLKREFIARYGGACVCCGETEPEFLTLDHVHNDGHLYRASSAKGGGGVGNDKIMRRLRRAGWPEQTEYQVLCFNCNCAKGYFGSCPHRRERN